MLPTDEEYACSLQVQGCQPFIFSLFDCASHLNVELIKHRARLVLDFAFQHSLSLIVWFFSYIKTKRLPPEDCAATLSVTFTNCRLNCSVQNEKGTSITWQLKENLMGHYSLLFVLDGNFSRYMPRSLRGGCTSGCYRCPQLRSLSLIISNKVFAAEYFPSVHWINVSGI